MESRKLCDFEKNVLLTLIGCVIQQSKFMNYSQDCSNNCATVGEMLRLLCNTLEEQIEHRKYFFKSGSLVHEGMIVVNSSGDQWRPYKCFSEWCSLLHNVVVIVVVYSCYCCSYCLALLFFHIHKCCLIFFLTLINNEYRMIRKFDIWRALS